MFFYLRSLFLDFSCYYSVHCLRNLMLNDMTNIDKENKTGYRIRYRVALTWNSWSADYDLKWKVGCNLCIIHVNADLIYYRYGMCNTAHKFYRSYVLQTNNFPEPINYLTLINIYGSLINYLTSTLKPDITWSLNLCSFISIKMR